MSQRTLCAFPGQGTQSPRMSEPLQGFRVARRVYDQAQDVLGWDVRSADGSTDAMVCQPAVLTASVAAWRVAEAHGLTPEWVVGHSLGEYAALVAAGALSFEDALILVQERARLTGDVAGQVPGGMAAVLGLTDEEVRSLCASTTEVWPANFNAPGQVVISGRLRYLERLVDVAKAQGARVRMLAVDGAFHSPVMASAREKFAPLVARVPLRTPHIRFLSPTTARCETRVENIRHVLSAQLDGPVRFVETVEMAVSQGARRLVECGPTPVLGGLVKRISSRLSTDHVGASSQVGDLGS